MHKADDFSSVFADDLRGYVTFEAASGKSFRVEETILKAFDRFVLSKGVSEITEDLVSSFTYQIPDLSTLQYHKRHRVIRKFSEYLCRIRNSGQAVRPLPKLPVQGRHIPYMYLEEEILSLLKAAEGLGPKDSLRPHTYYLLIGLLYSTGLRISEAINLDVADVDMETGILSIRNTKFRKSRLVPVHSTTLDVLRRYAVLRSHAFPADSHTPFFVNNRNARLKYSTVNATFLLLLRKTGIRLPDGSGARIHDARHNYAVRRMAAWYDAGEDIQEWLPVLSTFMGHAHFEDTAYYISASAELLAKGAVRFQKGGGSIE